MSIAVIAKMPALRNAERADATAQMLPVAFVFDWLKNVSIFWQQNLLKICSIIHGSCNSIASNFFAAY